MVESQDCIKILIEALVYNIILHYFAAFHISINSLNNLLDNIEKKVYVTFIYHREVIWCDNIARLFIKYWGFVLMRHETNYICAGRSPTNFICPPGNYQLRNIRFYLIQPHASSHPPISFSFQRLRIAPLLLFVSAHT